MPIRECSSLSLFMDGQGNFDFALVRYYHEMAKCAINLEKGHAERVIHLGGTMIPANVPLSMWEAKKSTKKSISSSSLEESLDKHSSLTKAALELVYTQNITFTVALACTALIL